jgi:hypothetical protein
MQNFAKGFIRNPDGSWQCVAPVRYITSNGETVSCTPGTTYRRGHRHQGVDLAGWLHNWHQFRVEPSGITFPEDD